MGIFNSKGKNLNFVSRSKGTIDHYYVRVKELEIPKACKWSPPQLSIFPRKFFQGKSDERKFKLIVSENFSEMSLSFVFEGEIFC